MGGVAPIPAAPPPTGPAVVEATLLSAEEQAQEPITGTKQALGGLNKPQVNLAPLKVLAGRDGDVTGGGHGRA